MKCRQRLDLRRVLSFRRINKKGGELFNQEIQKITASNLKKLNMARKKHLEEIYRIRIDRKRKAVIGKNQL